jgi:hypothetical protein
MSSKREGEISPRQVTKRTGCCILTAYNWCRRACGEGGGPLAGGVRRDSTGHYWIKIEAVELMLSKRC